MVSLIELNKIRLGLVVCGLLACMTISVMAADRDPNESAAERLLATTVTVRTTMRSATLPVVAPAPGTPQADEVVVSSGVSLGKGRLVTFVGDRDAMAARFRVTLPAGEQAEGKLRVWDHYSGLVLLKIEAADLPGLEPAKDLPNVGATVLTAAAAGIDKPAVSAGILSGADRTLPVIDLPPLLQCDVRTTETSSGAAVVDRDGRLIGIVAANTVPGERPDWTYAVPMSHVARLLAAETAGQVIELKRHRPAVGFTLGPAEKEGFGPSRTSRKTVPPPAPDSRRERSDSRSRRARRSRECLSSGQPNPRHAAKQPGDKVAAVDQPEHGGKRGGRSRLTLDAAGAALPRPGAGVANRVRGRFKSARNSAFPARPRIRSPCATAKESKRSASTLRHPPATRPPMKSKCFASKSTVLKK